MIKQVFASKYQLFDLSNEEKEVFMMAVNKLSTKVYKRGETISSKFLNAIDTNNFKDAMAYFLELSWKGIALKILHGVHTIHRIEDEADVKDYVEVIMKFAASYKEAEKEHIFKECPECKWPVDISDNVCEGCGALFDET